MTPDMKRLCLAAEHASRTDDVELTDDEVEAIVRAVLTELLRATEDHYDCDRYAREFNGYVRLMVDAVLGEPAAA